MSTHLRTIWNHSFNNKWGRFLIVLLFVLVAFLGFLWRVEETTRNDELILIGITAALSVGLIASLLTTEYYGSRSIGLFFIILGSAFYYFYIFLRVSRHQDHTWMADFTRACFVVGAPLFAISTIIALVQSRRSRHAHQDE